MIGHRDWLAEWLAKKLAEPGDSEGDVIVWPTTWAVDYNTGGEWDWAECDTNS